MSGGWREPRAVTAGATILVTVDGGVITQITPKRVAELTEADAVADGFRDLAELQDRLRFHYPGIKPTDDATVVHFRLTS